MSKFIAAEEALRLVPGVRVDNQHNGKRVHFSIRGQGILTERGPRGIGVIVDSIPLNDPSGFIPDLYDIDWTTISTIEILRGPAAGLYGGIININTVIGCKKTIGGELSQSLRTNGFRKSLAQVDGSQQQNDYRLTFSRTNGNEYRDHQAFWGNKLYEKINFKPSPRINITQILSYTDFFHQNPEGLNLEQFNNLKQANPDVNPFNEYQKTKRTTLGFNGNFAFSKLHDEEVTAYLRSWNYKETSNKSAEYRSINNPGATFQYNLHLTSERLSNHLSIGIDYKYQQIDMYKLQSATNPQRVESIDETNIETDSILANQIISQQNSGFFALTLLIKILRLVLTPNFSRNGPFAQMLKLMVESWIHQFLKTGKMGLIYTTSGFLTYGD